MSAAGRDVTSPADTLRELLANAERDPDYEWTCCDWLTEHAAAVLALLDAAEDALRVLDGDYVPGSRDALAAAVTRLTQETTT